MFKNLELLPTTGFEKGRNGRICSFSLKLASTTDSRCSPPRNWPRQGKKINNETYFEIPGNLWLCVSQ
jgi:hypothetical protein